MQRRARLVLRWATVSGFNSRCRTFISVCNQPATQGQLSLPSLGVGKWVPASAGKAKAGMVHSVSGWTWGVHVKLWDPLRTRAIPERLRGVFTMRRYTNTRLPYLTLPRRQWLYSVWAIRRCSSVASYDSVSSEQCVSDMLCDCERCTLTVEHVTWRLERRSLDEAFCIYHVVI